MERSRRNSPLGLIGGMVLAGLAACSRGETAAAPQPAPPVQIGRESVTTVKTESIATGPAISGELSAETQATVRAKIGGSVLSMAAEQGQAVAKGAVLARIEARDLGEAVSSATVAIGAAEQALKLAQTEVQRAERLVAGGALAQRDLDNARNAVVTADSQVAAARARGTTARAQLGDTVVRSPIRGVVSRKPANTGDVVAMGAELYTVIDPTSMRLEAAVPSDQIQHLRPGLTVVFTVKGYDDPYQGTITRINPAADPVTRQVPILVSIPNSTGRLIAGLYAEGRVQTAAKSALVVPATAIDTAGGSPSVTRIKDGKAERVAVGLGLRDTRTERVEVVSGLVEGDLVLTGAARGVTPGTPVTVIGNATAETR
ncbi:MAG: efflux RND transporter periplasmic adaptor subunit [Vicinamibacterales bacterium]